MEALHTWNGKGRERRRHTTNHSAGLAHGRVLYLPSREKQRGQIGGERDGGDDGDSEDDDERTLSPTPHSAQGCGAFVRHLL